MGLEHRVYIVSLVLLQLLGAFIFLKGFFPIKTSIPGYAGQDDLPRHPLYEERKVAPPMTQYKKLIFILIDALRYDFVLNTTDREPYMPYVSGLIRDHKANAYVAKSHPPTVTMPRIKAMTTGSMPGFVDIVLNFDSKALLEDNIIDQLYRTGRKLVFYGDDTWLKLFPGYFSRFDGTTSFFVTDYTEVDNNVTRHVPRELSNTDWDVMILHYLGLDHIGHMAGPSSPLMPPKLREMDSIVKLIHGAVLQEDKLSPTLIMVCGDHGMSDQGSHGGSSHNEIFTPMVFISSSPFREDSIHVDTIDQIDLVPTLALLLGFPIPQNNLGKVIAGMLSSLPLAEQLNAYLINADQLFRVYSQSVSNVNKSEGYRLYQGAIQRHRYWLSETALGRLSGNETKIARKIILQYTHAMEVIQNKLISSLAQYDMPAMFVGIVITWLVLCGVLYGLFVHTSPDTSTVMPQSNMVWFVGMFCSMEAIVCHIVLCTSTGKSQTICPDSRLVLFGMEGLIIVVTISSTLVVYGLVTFIKSLVISWKYQYQCLPLYGTLWVGTSLHTLSLASSSYVEEEHQTWYFVTVTLHLVILGKFLSKCFPRKNTPVLQTKTYTYKNPQKSSTDESDLVEVVDTNRLVLRRKRKNLSRSDTHEEQIKSVLRDKSSHHNETRHVRFENIDDSQELSYTSDDVTMKNVMAAIALLFCDRLLRTMNQTGNKWIHLVDYGDWLIRPENKAYLSAVVLASLLTIAFVQWKTFKRWPSLLLFICSLTGVYCQKATTGHVYMPYIYNHIITKGIYEARIVYSFLLVFLIYALWKYICNKIRLVTQDDTRHITGIQSTVIQDILTIWIVLSLLLLRTHNTAVVLGIVVQHYCLTKHILPFLRIGLTETALVFVWMGQAAFYYQGNSNSIATVDVSSGYVGVVDYNPIIIVSLMCCATYSGPVFWLLALINYYKIHRTHFNKGVHHLLYGVILTRSLPLSLYCLLVTIERYHLFVWTVFSPKLLYEGMLLLVVSFLVLLTITLSS